MARSVGLIWKPAGPAKIQLLPLLLFRRCILPSAFSYGSNPRDMRRPPNEFATVYSIRYWLGPVGRLSRNSTTTWTAEREVRYSGGYIASASHRDKSSSV